MARPVADGIHALVERLGAARPSVVGWMDGGARPAVIGPDVEAIVTRREPARAQALADAPDWLCVPLPFGFGLALTIDPYEPVVGDDGLISVAPLTFAYTVYDRMDGGEFSESTSRHRLERVVLEDGEWRVAAFWDEDGRTRDRTLMARLRAHVAR